MIKKNEEIYVLPVSSADIEESGFHYEELKIPYQQIFFQFHVLKVGRVCLYSCHQLSLFRLCQNMPYNALHINNNFRNTVFKIFVDVPLR